MLPSQSIGFQLDHRLEKSTKPIVWLGLCELRLRDDLRWPWVILIPQRPGITEIHDLSPLDQAMLTFEMNMVSKALKVTTGCDKINIGALGNVVEQLHLHIVARTTGDTNWPDPVWGYGMPEPYEEVASRQFCNNLRENLLAVGA